MKILVFSDSHGSPDYIRAALRAHGGTADLLYFLGDGVRDIAAVLEEYPHIPRVILSGNNDSALAAAAAGIAVQTEDIRTVEGVKIFALHGHTARVKWGYDIMICRASELEADLILFGHTHVPENTSVNAPFGISRRIHLFNPGSVGLSMTHPYGVIYVIDGKISADHGTASL